jgi:succinoglycan biosynthesis protein ExoA
LSASDLLVKEYRMPDGLPFVTVVVPTLNEERYIEACLMSLMTDLRNLRCEILVVDGGSTDQTVEKVAAMQTRQPGISVVHNPKRLQAAAVNLAATLASPDATVLLRADAHARYPADFIRTCVRALIESGATSVVVPMITEGTLGMQRAIAAVQNSLLGNGGSAHRKAGASRFVDHGHHAAFDRAFFQRVGGYDETFSHNEDAEFDARAARLGGRAWMASEAAVTYFPRRTLEAATRQYVNHGRGRAKTLSRHKLWPRTRQMAPLAIALGCMGGGFLAMFNPAFLAVPLGYAGLCNCWGIVASIRRRDPWLLAMGVAAMAMHFGWAAGFLSELTKQCGSALSRKPRKPGQANATG